MCFEGICILIVYCGDVVDILMDHWISSYLRLARHQFSWLEHVRQTKSCIHLMFIKCALKYYTSLQSRVKMLWRCWWISDLFANLRLVRHRVFLKWNMLDRRHRVLCGCLLGSASTSIVGGKAQQREKR